MLKKGATKMKILQKLTLPIFFIPAIAFAEMPNMGGANMQQMMMKMQDLEACMKKVDQNALEKLSEKGEKLQNNIQTLCHAGKKDEAQKELIKFSNTINSNNDLRKMRECVNKIDLPMIKSKLDDKFDLDTSQNICDSMKR